MKTLTQQVIETEDRYHDRIHAAYFGMKDALAEEVEINAQQAARDKSSEFYYLNPANLIEAMGDELGFCETRDNDNKLAQLIITGKGDELVKFVSEVSLKYWEQQAADYFKNWRV